LSGEGPALKAAREHGDKNAVDLEIPIGANGMPLIKISCAAAELIPTMQYANVTIGPVVVHRYVEDTGDLKDIHAQVRATQSLCEEAVAEDRQTVHALTRQSTEGRYQN